MKVELKHYTPLQVADDAIGKCWDKPSTGECNIKRMHRVANQFKHASTIEHISYNFDIDGISRALLQELARHRHTSLSVKSTRYTLKELKNCADEDIQSFNIHIDDRINIINGLQLMSIRDMLQGGASNDRVKYLLPEAYKTSLVWTINARSLQNFLSLRTDKAALWEIRDLAKEIYSKLPIEHMYLFEEFVKDN